MTKLQALVAEIQRLLKVDIHSGQITLNIHQDRVQSIETRTHTRVEKSETTLDETEKRALH